MIQTTALCCRLFTAFPLAALIGLLLSLTAALQAVDLPTPLAEGETPEGLSKGDWADIRAAYEAGRHSFAPVADSPGQWQARNPGQQWTTRFDGRGFVAQPQQGGWQWGLELESYGFGETRHHITGTAEVRAEGQRLSYQWDESLSEWYVNDTRGLEHGFTVAERPAGTADRLSFTLAVRGGLRPAVQTGGQGVDFAEAGGATALTYAGLKVWDADGRVLASHFEAAGEERVRLLVDERGARYPLTIDPLAQQAYLKASNTEMNDRFGNSVAVSGDTVVVGAYQESSNATGVNGDQTDNSVEQAGAAYVFTRSAGTWTQQAYLKASNPGTFDQFGKSVAISGDTIVVGAYYEGSNATGVDGNQTDNSVNQAGAAYVFTRSAGTWTQQAYLKASNTGTEDWFGYTVAVSGDTAVVGAIFEDSNATGLNGDGADNSALQAGAAYVFTRSAGTWTQQAYLKASNTGTGDNFGSSVTASGDTVAVVASREDSNATGVNGDQTNNSSTDAGAAYVFTRSDGTWTQQAYLKASNTGASDQFGSSVTVSGDTAVVGAYGESSNATGVNGDQTNNSASASGAAYVFTRSAGTWTQEAYLKASNTGGSDLFGFSAAVSGDTVVVGAFREGSNATGVNGDQTDNSAGASGAAYVFKRSAGTWTQKAYLKASNTGASDQFGCSVAVSGDTAVVGAFEEDSNATGVNGDGTDNSASSSGAAYTFTLSTEPTVSITATTATAAEAGATGLYTFTRDESAGALTVDFQLEASSTATAGTDFTLASTATLTFDNGTGAGTLVIPDGQTSATVTLTALEELNDSAEAAETARLDLVDGAAYAVGSPGNATVTIILNGSTVTSTADSGTGSLRQAIANVNASDPGDNNSISFDADVFATAQTITLASGLVISRNVRIGGPAVAATLSGGGTSEVLSIQGPGVNIVSLSDLIIADGFTTRAGGGIYCEDASLTLVRCTVRNNTADETSGGGIYFNAVAAGRYLLVRDSTISGNTADGGGGGIEISNSPNGNLVRIVNSTISGNTGGSAGGVWNTLGTTFLVNCTVTGNTGTGVGGIGTIGETYATTRLGNCLVVGNTGGDVSHLVGTTNSNFSLGSNLIGTGTSLAQFTAETTAAAVDTILNPILANNGGTTRTHALVYNSPAVNAGNASLAVDPEDEIFGNTDDLALDNDQRGAGFARTVLATDIGAYELYAAPVFTRRVTVPASGGRVDLAAASGATPPGGTFSGPGVSAGFFDPRGLPVGLYRVVYTAVDDFGVTFPAAFTVEITPSEASLDVEKPGTFSDTVVGQRSRTQMIRVKNTGGATAEKLRLVVSSAGRKHFRVKQPAAKTLAPKASTTFRATFKPKAKARHSATVTVSSAGASTSVILQGRGLEAKPVFVRPGRGGDR